MEAIVKEQLRLGIIEESPSFAKWQSRALLVKKTDGSMRMVIDLRAVNKAVLDEKFPFLTLEELQYKLVGSKIFTVLDLKNAFFHLKLHPDSRDLTTFVTSSGVYRYTVLVFGLKSASEIFQRKMMQHVIKGLKGVVLYIDDVLIYACDKEEHDKILAELLRRFEELQIQLNEQKSQVAQRKVRFIGHDISEEGVKPAPEKIQLIKGFREPISKEQVRSFLGLVSYVLSRQSPSYVEPAKVLRKLAQDEAPFAWKEDHQKAFEELKSAAEDAISLSFFDKKKRTLLYADASPTDVGAVLSQVDDMGEHQVVQYATKTLSALQRRYSQTDREALALVWAADKFRYFLYGLHFELVTDHKALQHLFGCRSKPSPRLDRWVMLIQELSFTVKFVPGKQQIADCFSRLCSGTLPEDDAKWDDYETYILHVLETSLVNALTVKELERASAEDEVIQKVIRALDGQEWTEELKAYRLCSDELCVVGKMLLRGFRIVVPTALRERAKLLIHEGHPGIQKSREIIRRKMWWPGIMKEIDNMVDSCIECKRISARPRPEPMHRHVMPDSPWAEIGMDLLGPLPNGKQLLVLVCYRSRFPIVRMMNRTMANDIVAALKEIFSERGNPRVVRMDNGPQFNSQELREYLRQEGVEMDYTTPYFPRQNGLVERMNRSIKEAIQRALNEGKSWIAAMYEFLKMYRSTPHCVTKKTPAELMAPATMRTKIPDGKEVFKELEDQSELIDADKAAKETGKAYGDRHAASTQSAITTGDRVLIAATRPGTKWSPHFQQAIGTVLSRQGNECVIEVASGAKYRRDVAHLVKVNQCPLAERVEADDSDDIEIDQELNQDEQNSVEEVEQSGVAEFAAEPARTFEQFDVETSNTGFKIQAENASTPLAKRVRRAPMWQQDFEMFDGK